MSDLLRCCFKKSVFYACFLMPIGPLHAAISPPSDFNIGPTKGQVAGVVIGIAAVGAGIGVGVYYLIRHGNTLTGCTVTTPNGVALISEGDQKIYTLAGVATPIQPGERLRIRGKKQKSGPTANKTFLLEKVSKDFGACKSPPSATLY